MIGKLGKEALMKFVVSLTKDIFPQLATLSVIDNFERKFRIGGAGTKDLRAEKRFTLFISNEDMDNIIINIKTRENSDLINNGVTETIKHEIKKTRRWTSYCFISTCSCFTNSTYVFFMDWKCACKRSQ